MNENDLTEEEVSSTYGRLVQVVDDKYYDGFGNPLNLSNNINNSGVFNIDGGNPYTINNNRIFKIDFGGIV